MKRAYCIVFFVLSLFANIYSYSAESRSFMLTEICVANIDQTIDFSNNYGSWIELYNPTTDSIELDGWYISDDDTNLKKHQLKGYGKLEPGGYQCVFFDHNASDGEYGSEAYKQVGFKLNRKGGTLYLSENGSDIDIAIDYPESVPRCSYARTAIENDEWSYCGLPTPGTANCGYYADSSLPVPEVDCNSCLFSSEFEVGVTIPAETTLRYTTDGSTPTLSNGATSVDGRFCISKNTVLRLRLFSDDRLPSGVVTRTYIFKDRDYYLPIVAITTDPKNLYDDIIGCYIDGKNGIKGRGSTVNSNLNMDWVRPVNFEYLTADGDMAINQEASFEVAGGYSRHFKPASFKVQAKKMYDGNGSFDYPVFVNKPYCEYKQLLIRNGGNNNRTDGGPRIKDAITQQILTSAGFYVDAQEYQPAHVFINGKYLAMLNVREPSNRYHGVANYGYDEDEMDGFEYSDHTYQQKCGTREAFGNLMQLSETADTDEGFARVSEILDIDEFAHYMAAVCYSGTGDWILNSNNLKAYRSTDDGKFHFVFFDQDLTWEKTNNVGDIDAENEIIDLYHNLKRNEKFREKFVASYCILDGSVYTTDRCVQIADSICSLVKVALSYDSRYTALTYEKLKSTMWDESHREARIKSLMDTYSLTGRIHVNLATNCPSARLRIGGIDVPFNKFTGVLFDSMFVSTSSAETYRFAGWMDQQGNIVSQTAECRFNEDGSYTAIYEPNEIGMSPVCINELSCANDVYVNDYGKHADWIELYNRSDNSVDLATLFFYEKSSSANKYQIDAASGLNTIIQPNNHIVVWCDGKPSLTQLHLPFKLKNADNNILYLQSSNTVWNDSISFSGQSSKESIGRYPDGGKDIATFYHPTIGGCNITTMYDITNNPSSTEVISIPLSENVESIDYYTIEGIKSIPRNGIYIAVEHYKDEHFRARKIVKRRDR